MTLLSLIADLVVVILAELGLIFLLGLVLGVWRKDEVGDDPVP